MRVSLRFIADELARLMGKDFPPTNESAMREVIGTIARHAEDEAHVKRIIDHLVAVPGKFPEPATFAVAADITASMVLMADPSCRRCDGCGFRSQYRGGIAVELKCMCCGALSQCEACLGTGKFTVMRGGQWGTEKCDCWGLRPKGLRPWAMEVQDVQA
jgi:hypothetical protein